MKRILKTFCQETSIHGVAYLVDRRIHVVEKFFWCFALIISSLSCVSLVWRVVEIIRIDPIVTYTSDVAIPVGEIPFIGVTFCPGIEAVVENFNYEELKKDMISNEIAIENITQRDLKLLQAVGLITKDDFLLQFNVTIDTTDIIDNIIELKAIWNYENWNKERGMHHHQLEFADEWGVDLAEILTPWGFCYNFNIIDAKDLFNIERVANVFNYTRPISFRHLTHARGRIAKTHNQTYPWKTIDSRRGFYSLIKLKSTKIDVTKKSLNSYTFQGSSYRFHNPHELPFLQTFEFISHTESYLQYFVTPKIPTLGDTIVNYGLERRQCYFQHEKPLKFFKYYSRSSCSQECLSNLTLNTCGCVQFFMIHEEKTNICGIIDQKCCRDVEKLFNEGNTCCCFPRCDEIVYDVEVIKMDHARNKLGSFEAYYNGSKIHVFFKNSEFYPSIRQRQFTEIEFISYFGCTLGLFAGFSMLTFFEMIYYLICRGLIRYSRNIVTPKMNVKVDSEVINHRLKSETKLNDLKRSMMVPFKHVCNYLKESSIHGLNVAAKKNIVLIERFMWLIAFGASISLCGFLLRNLQQKYENAPIILSLDGNTGDVQNIDFPAITFTNEGRLAILYEKMFLFFLILSPQEVMRILQDSNNFEEYHIQEMLCQHSHAIFRPYYYAMPELVDKIRNRSKVSWFSNQVASWDKIFAPVFFQVPTKRGFGFSFNLMESSKMFTDQISKDFYSELHLVKTRKPKSAVNVMSGKNYPVKSMSSHGLEITLKRDLNVPYKEICLQLAFTVHSPHELPNGFDFTDYCQFGFGQTLDILITPEVINTDVALKEVAPEVRKCFFEGEKKLKFYKIYTVLNCQMECYAEYIDSECFCTPFYLVRNDTANVCDLDWLKCVMRITSSEEIAKCGCLEPCNNIKYKIEIIQNLLSSLYNDSYENEITLKFRFKDNEFFPTRRYQPFTTVEFLAQSGGLVGLFVGASVLSFVEFFYFFSIRIISNIFRKIFA